MPRLNPPEVDRVAAAQAAVAARRARAAVKNAVAARERSALDVAEAAWTGEPGPEATLRVRELLTSMPGLGPVRASALMERLEIAEAKRVGGLGVRQRRRLREFLVEREGGPARARLVVLAGPTAVGKGTVSTYIRDNFPSVLLSVSATTRAPRPGEVEGKHYFFVDQAEFDRLIAEDLLLEWATVHNRNRYGTPRGPVEAALEAGDSVLLEIDIQGARQVKQAMPDAVLVFLLPPSWEEMVRRLVGRGTEPPEEQQRRLETAKVELAAQGEFDHAVVNDDVARAAQEVVDLMTVPAAR